jgi:rRNA maturation protein Rpf1
MPPHSARARQLSHSSRYSSAPTQIRERERNKKQAVLAAQSARDGRLVIAAYKAYCYTSNKVVGSSEYRPRLTTRTWNRF